MFWDYIAYEISSSMGWFWFIALCFILFFLFYANFVMNHYHDCFEKGIKEEPNTDMIVLMSILSLLSVISIFCFIKYRDYEKEYAATPIQYRINEEVFLKSYIVKRELEKINKMMADKYGIR